MQGGINAPEKNSSVQKPQTQQQKLLKDMMQQPGHGGPLVKFTTNSKNPTTQKSSGQNSRKTSQSMSPHTAKALADDRRKRQQMQNMNADLMKDFRSGAGVKNDGKKNM